MTIEIPKGYRYSAHKNTFQESEDDSYAYEENGNLIIVGSVPFERLMYDLTYNLKGRDTCYYCKTDLTEDNRTLDHKYPKDFGGISLPINLVPCCTACNEKKGNLTSHQFKELVKKPGSKQQKEFRRQKKEKNQKIQSVVGFYLPEEWISLSDLGKVRIEIDLENKDYFKSKKYKKIKTFYKQHHCFPRPVITSSNNFLLDGFLILMYAKNYNINHLYCIQLDNVIVQ